MLLKIKPLRNIRTNTGEEHYGSALSLKKSSACNSFALDVTTTFFMSEPRYEPLSQADDATIIPIKSRSPPSYNVQAPESSRAAYEGRSSSDDEDEEERMKLQEGSFYNEDLEEDVTHKESVGIHLAGKSCAR